jgi:hypothetical protein
MDNQDRTVDQTNPLNIGTEEVSFESCIIVVLGASGDLAARKIIPD